MQINRKEVIAKITVALIKEIKKNPKLEIAILGLDIAPLAEAALSAISKCMPEMPKGEFAILDKSALFYGIGEESIDVRKVRECLDVYQAFKTWGEMKKANKL